MTPSTREPPTASWSTRSTRWSRLTLLLDDKVFVPSNTVIALLSEPVATPDLVATLDAIGASLTTQRLAQMLNEINANGTDPIVVANAFLDTL